MGVFRRRLQDKFRRGQAYTEWDACILDGSLTQRAFAVWGPRAPQLVASYSFACHLASLRRLGRARRFDGPREHS